MNATPPFYHIPVTHRDECRRVYATLRGYSADWVRRELKALNLSIAGSRESDADYCRRHAYAEYLRDVLA